MFRGTTIDTMTAQSGLYKKNKWPTACRNYTPVEANELARNFHKVPGNYTSVCPTTSSTQDKDDWWVGGRRI